MTWKVRDVDTNHHKMEDTENKKIDMFWVSGGIIDMGRQQSKPMEVCVKRNFTYERFNIFSLTLGIMITSPRS